MKQYKKTAFIAISIFIITIILTSRPQPLAASTVEPIQAMPMQGELADITSADSHAVVTDIPNMNVNIDNLATGRNTDFLTQNKTAFAPLAAVTTFPYTQDFESFSTCIKATPCPLSSDWVNPTDDDFDWTVDAGGTDSVDTGPDEDRNPGTATGKYLFTESSSQYNDTAHLVTPQFDLSQTASFALSFWYHMYGSNMGTMHVDISTNGGSSWTTDIVPSWTDNNDVWQEKEIDLSAYAGQTITLRIRGITGSGLRSDMAIDNFRLGAPDTFAKTYGGSSSETIQNVQQTSDGGYIVAGYTDSYGAGGNDYWVLKLDSSGNVTWQKTYGGSGRDYGSSIQQTSDGGYIVAGYTDSFGAGSYDYWILKLDSNGNITWQKTYGGSSSDYGSSIQQTSDDGYIVAGGTNSFGAGGSDYWVLKLDSSGNITWQKTYGGSGSDNARNIQQTSDSGYIVAGYTSSYGAGGNDGWILKLDNIGNVTWQKTYGGSGNDYITGVQQTSDGDYIVAGYTDSFGAGGSDYWVFKLGSSGNVTWQNTYGGSSNDNADSIQQTSDGGYIVSGFTDSFGAGARDSWVLKLDSSGNVIWQKTYGGSGYDDARSIQQTSDGGYIVAGYTSSYGAGVNDFWVRKLDSNGSLNVGCAASETDTGITATNLSATVSTPIFSSADTSISAVFSSEIPANSAATPAFTCGGPPAWTFSKTVDDSTPNAGDVINYTLTLANTGSTEISGAALFDELPAGQTLAGPITLTPANAGVVGDADTLPALAHSLTIPASSSIIVTLPVTVTIGGVYVNTARALAPTSIAATEADRSITVNAYPTGGNNSVALNEDGSHTFTTSQFLYNDLEGDAMTAVKITALPASGSLTCNSLPITIGDDCIVSAATQHLTFTPDPDESGTPYANFGFRVKAAAGAPYSNVVYTMTLNVNAVSDPPVGANESVTTDENVGYTFQTADFTFSDADNDTLNGVQIVSLESAGDLECAGSDVTLGQTCTNVTQLTFMPATNQFGNPYAVFNFKLRDSSGTLSTATYQMTINVTDVAEPPTGADDTVTAVEDTLYTFQTADFTFSDGDNDTFAGIELASLETAGDLEYAGAPVTAGTVYADVTQLTFDPAPNGNGSPYATFDFYVRDSSGATSAASYTMDIDVTAVNDPPTGGDGAVTTAEDTAYTFNSSDFPFNDPIDGDSFGGIRITSVESAGDLECNNVNVSVGTTCTNITQLTFAPTANASGTPYATFQFRVRDDGGAVSPAMYTMTVDVTAVADTPTSTNTSVTTPEDTIYNFAATDFPFSDVDAGDSFASMRLDALESAGDLKCNGVDMSVGMECNSFSTFFYAESFEGTDGGWTSGGTNSSWARGVPANAVINSAADGSEAWVTNLTGNYNADEQSYVQKLFDFSSLTNDPFIELDVWWNSENSWDGAKLQTSTDSGTTWVTVGTLGDPDNWYTDGSINGLSWTDNQNGWTGRNSTSNGSNGWVTAGHALTGMAGESSVWLRIAFGSDDTVQDEGFAFDNVRIFSGLTFTPAANAFGTPYSTFQFKVLDNTGLSSALDYTMEIDVTPVSDPPTSGNAAVNGVEDIHYTFSAGDFPFTDLDSDTLSLIIIDSEETAGFLECSGTAVTILTACAPANLVYTPPLDANGSPVATFGFKVQDSSGQNSVAAYTMSINMAAAFEPPVGSNGLINISVDGSYDFITDDFAYYDGDGDAMAGIRLTTLPAAGTLTYNSGAVSVGPLYADVTLFTFTPAASASGVPYADFDFRLEDATGALSVDSYTMEINVQSGNPPTGGNNSVTVSEDIAYTFVMTDFVYNDADGDALDGIWFASVPSTGDLLCNGAELLAGSQCSDVTRLIFTPAPNVSGSSYATFQFRVRDDAGFLSPATYLMTIDVTPVNDAPIIYSTSITTTLEDMLYSYAFVSDDVDLADSLTITATSTLPSWMTFADHGDGTATLSGTPNNDQRGWYEINLMVEDTAGEQANEDIFLTVLNVNDPPVITSTAVISTIEDSFYAYDVVAVDIDGFEPLTVTSALALPEWLTLGDRGGGSATLTGTPNNSEVGDYNISLQVSDPTGVVDTQSFILTVENLNEAPAFATVPVGAARAGQLYYYGITAVDIDPNELLSFSILSGPAWLNVIDNGNGTADLNGSPTFNDVGGYTVSLQVADRDGLTAVQTYILTVLNSPPTAVDDYASTPMNAPVIIDLRANDSDDDGNAITVIAVAQPFTGTTTLLNAAQVNFTPPVGFAGTAVFTYTVSDSKANSIGYAFVDVYSSPPVGVDDTAKTVGGFPVTIDVLNNDFDPDGEALIVTAVDSTGLTGTAFVAADGKTITYLPPAAFVGSAVFGYTLQVDGDASQMETAVVTVNVLDVTSITSDVSITRPNTTPTTFPEGEAREIRSDIYVTNNNLSDIAAGIVVTDTINVPVLTGSASSGIGSCTLSNSGAVCNIGVIPPGQTVLVHLDYAIGTAPGLGITSTVSSLSTDPTPGNDTVSTPFNVLIGRDTRIAGSLTVTADSFEFVAATGNTRGIGDVIIYDHFRLSDPADSAEFNIDGVAIITGTVAYVVGDQNIVRGVFDVDEFDNLQFTQVDEVYLTELGGFTANNPSLDGLNLFSGRVSGQANLALPNVGETIMPANIPFAFDLAPGPYVTGQTDSFDIPYFNASGDMLNISGVAATLIQQGNEHYLIGSGQMNLNLPGNALTQNIPYLVLKDDGAFADFAGSMELTSIELTVEGAESFTLAQPELDNDGLHDRTPSVLTVDGSSRSFLNNTDITRYGLDQVGKAISLPSINETIFAVNPVEMRIFETTNAYGVEILDGDLRLRLPQNYRTISGFDLRPSASNADIVLNVGEAQLTLHNPHIDGGDLVAGSITWKLPAAMGGGVETFNQSVRLDSVNLGSLPFPASIKAGEADGVDVDVISVDIRKANGSYRINLDIMMHIDLPGVPPAGLAGTMSNSTTGVKTTLDPFSFTVAGYEISSTGGANFDMENVRLQIEEAEMAYAEEQTFQAGFGLLLEHLGVDEDTVQIGDGKARLNLPDICLGTQVPNKEGELECKGGVSLTDLRADVVMNSDQTYDLSAEGAMELPDTPPGACSGIEASVSVSYDPNTGKQVFTMTPNASGGTLNVTDAQGNVVNIPLTKESVDQPTYIGGQRVPNQQQLSSLPDGIPFGAPGLLLTSAYFALNGCEVPLMYPTGPIFLSKIGGGFELDDGGIILRFTAGIDIKTKPTPKAEVTAPLRIDTDARLFLPKRWIEFSGGCMAGLTIDPWEAEQELDENFFDVEIELVKSDSCYGTYRFTSMDEGSVGQQVLGTGSGSAPATVIIASRYDQHPWFVRADGEFIYMEETPFATGFIEIDPRGVRMQLTSSDEIAEHFELEFTGGVNAWVDSSDEFWLTGFLQASFDVTLEVLWGVLPDVGMSFTAQIEFGHFIVDDSEKLMGFKGTAEGSAVIVPEACVRYFGCTSEISKSFSVGFFIDTDFNIATGNDIDNFQLATRNQVQRAYTAMQVTEGKLMNDSALMSLHLTPDSDLTFVFADKPESLLAGVDGNRASLAELLIDVDVPYKTTTRVTLQSQSTVPTMTLEAPGGALYGHDSLPATITYTEYSTYTTSLIQTPAASQGMGQLRAVHAVADYGTMDVLVDGQLTFAGLLFTDTAAYQSFAPGSHIVAFVAAGTTAPILAQATVNLDAGQDATVIATGQSGSVQAWAVEDDNSTRPGGRPYLRLLHTGSGLNSVDLVQRMGREYYIDIPYQGIGVYIKMYPMGYTVDVRNHADSAILSTLENIQLEEGGIYTIFLFEGSSGATATLIQDAVVPTELQIVHVAGNEGDLEIRLDGALITDSLSVGEGTTSLSLVVGSHQLVISNSVSILIDETINLDQEVPYTYVVEDVNGVAHGRIISTTQGASYGYAGVQLFHLASNVPAVDMLVRYGAGDEVALANDVAFGDLSGSVNARPGSTADIILRQAGTPQVLYTFTNVPLPLGDVVTLYLYEEAGQIKLASIANFTMGTKTTSFYEIEQAAAGNWVVHLHGDAISGADYTLLVDGDKPEPIIQDIEIIDVAGQPTLQWRLTSPMPETTIGLYYKAGTITETEVISESGQLVARTVDVYSGHTFTGTLSAPSDPNWANGTLQQYPIDLSVLQNGSYSIYITADDLSGGLTRMAAPDPLVVSHTWPTTWNAGLVITNEAYRKIHGEWTRFPSPEVEQYTLIGVSESGLRQEARIGGTSFNPYQTLSNLTPGETYTFTVKAWDGQENGDTTTSESVSFTVPGATFAVAGVAGLAVDVGQTVTTVITLSTTLDPYPALIGLYAGTHSDGVSIEFSQDIVTPTLAGTPVEVYISTSDYLPSGVYTATVNARGGGETVLFELQTAVIAPYFELTATPPATMEEGDALVMTIGATRYEGHTGEIWLMPQGLPLVDWSVDTTTLSGAGQATLTITDTALLQHGTYTFTLSAEDGRTSSTITRTLTVNKPTYALTTSANSITITAGVTQTAQVSLTIGVQGNWSNPVTLMLDPQMAPPFGQVGFGNSMDAFTQVTAPQEIVVRIETLPQTPAGSYLLPILAESGGIQRQVNLFLNIAAVNYAAVANNNGYVVAEDNILTEAAPGVMINDWNADGDPLAVAVNTTVANGTLTLAADGSFVYTPTLNFNGTDTFTYILSEAEPFPRAPQSIANSFVEPNNATCYQEETTMCFTAYNNSPDGEWLDGVTLALPPNWIATCNSQDTDDFDSGGHYVSFSCEAAGNVVTYADNNGGYGEIYNGRSWGFCVDASAPAAFGEQTFGWTLSGEVYGGAPHDVGGSFNVDSCTIGTVNISVLPVDDAPVANGDWYTGTEDITLVTAAPGVIGNDWDAEGDPLTVVLNTDVTSGTLALAIDGSFVYTPDLNFNGQDSFSYIFNESASLVRSPEDTGGSFIAPDSACYQAEATTTMCFSAYNASSDTEWLDGVTLALPVGWTTACNSQDTTDSGGNPVSFSCAAAGNVVAYADGDGGLGEIAYGNSWDFCINATAPAASGTQTVEWGISGDDYGGKPHDVNGSLNVDSCAVGTVMLSVLPINDAPVANDDWYATSKDVAITTPAPGVIGNDSDIDNDSLTATVDTDVTSGTLTLAIDGSFVYTPNSGFIGQDSFTYTLSDGILTSTSVVTITVSETATFALTSGDVITNTPYAMQVYTITLNNLDSVADTFTVSYAASDTSSLGSGSPALYDWVVKMPTTVAVSAGLNASIPITVEIPALETSWVTHTLTVTVTSQNHGVAQDVTLTTSTGGRWNGTNWVGCRFDFYNIGTIIFADALLVYDEVSSGSVDPRYTFHHAPQVIFADALLIYQAAQAGATCAP